MKAPSVPIHTYIIFIVGILIYIITLQIIKGNIFNLYSDKGFNIDKYYKFWEDMTSVQRLFLSETYYKFYLNLTDEIDAIKNNIQNNNLDLEVHYLNSTYFKPTLQLENVPYILASFIPKNKNFSEKRLLICAHFNGHNLTSGGTAYDDAIHVVSMLGAMQYLSKNNINLNTQVDFLFDGAEEYALLGAYQYADYLKEKNLSINYDYLNLESMGGGPPYAFVIKNGKGNYRIQKALSYTSGSILLAMNYLYDTGFVQSTTDHEVFNEQGWLGGVNVFLGKSSVYHTKYDKIDSDKGKEHLKMAGNQLIDFILNYEPEGYDGNSIGYGIAPMCVVLPVLWLYILIPLFFVVTIFAIFIKERKNRKEFFFDLLMQFICFIIVLAIFLILGLLLSFINSNSSSGNQVFAILSAFMGLFLFLIFHRILKIKKWSRFKLVFISLLMMICITTDLSIPFLSLNILSTIFYFFDNKIIKYVTAIIQYLIMSLYFSFVITVFMQFTTRVNNIIGNVGIYLIYFFFSYHISVSPLDLYEIPEKEKLLDLIKFMFSKKKIDNSSLNDENQYNILDELIDEVQSKSTLKSFITYKQRFINKKFIPVYLFFLYDLYFLILLLILFFKPAPFSEDYVLRGTFLNVYKSSNSSTMLFFPQTIGYNFAKKKLKDSDFKNVFKEESISNYIYSEYQDYDCTVFAVDSNENLSENNQECDFSMPNINEIVDLNYHNNTAKDRYDFTFSFNIPNKYCIDSLYLYIHCDDCIIEANGKTYDDRLKKLATKRKIFLKVGKKEIKGKNDTSLADIITKTNFVLNTNNFKYSLYLVTMKNSKDYLKFMDSFGEAICNARSTMISDTIFKYEGYYSSQD